MNIRVRTITAPSLWASALVNGDFSGLNAAEAEQLEAWRAKELGPQESIVSTADDSEPRFTWSYRLYGGGFDGGEVIDYVAHDLEGSHAAG